MTMSSGPASYIVGVGYHRREYRPPKRACKEAPRVVYPICPARDCHHVFSHPRALHTPSTDSVRGQSAFADSLAVLWRVLAAISGGGLVVSLFMKGLPLHNTLDADWTLKREKEDRSI